MVKGLDSAVAGIDSRLASFERAAKRIAQPGGDATLVRDIVQTMDDSHGVEANAKVVRAADDMLGTLIDIFA
jgi:hypothetical protein